LVCCNFSFGDPRSPLKGPVSHLSEPDHGVTGPDDTPRHGASDGDLTWMRRVSPSPSEPQRSPSLGAWRTSRLPSPLKGCDDVNSAPAPFTRRISCPQALGYESGRSARSQLILALDTTERSLTRRFGRGIQAEAARPDVLQRWVSHPSLPD
jgi:hypothetical protein